VEFPTSGVGAQAGLRARNLFEIGHPDIDWVLLAKVLACHAGVLTSLEASRLLLKKGSTVDGPMLIGMGL